MLHCSFCGKSQDQVSKLIAGPQVYICDECVLACMGILITGWICPKCGKSLAPSVTECRCEKKESAPASVIGAVDLSVPAETKE